MRFSEELITKVWNKGRVDPDQDSDVWRKDECGAWIKRSQYGNRNLEFGWEIAHIVAGSGDDLSNLRVLHWQNYNEGRVGRVICKVTADYGGIKNKEK